MFPAGDERFRVQFVSLPSGLRLRVVECGDQHSDSVAVCVHGWACSVYSYRLLMPLLAAAGVRAVAMDLQGHGLSDKPLECQPYTIDALVESVRQTMDVLGIEHASLVGHSMGGPICAWLAVTSPERVRGIALLAPAGFGDEWPLRIGSAATPRFVAPALPYLVPRWLVGSVLQLAYGTQHPPTPRDVDEYWAPSQFPGYTRAMWDILHGFDWKAGANGEFASIEAPTVAMVGTADHFVVHRWVRRYADSIRHATFMQIPQCGHVLAEETPEVVRDAVMALTR